MEHNTKTNRRRPHDHPELAADVTQSKRRRKREVELDHSDSVLIVGETHPNGDVRINSSKRMIPNGACPLPGTHGTGGRCTGPGPSRGKERVPNGVQPRGDTHSSHIPTLPPNPRESERMLFVQQWINNIRPDLPLWVQTSLTQIVPITNPTYYPTEEDPMGSSELTHEGKRAASDVTRLSPPEQLTVRSGASSNHMSQSYDYHTKQTHLNPQVASSSANAIGMLGPRYPNATGAASSTAAGNGPLLASLPNYHSHHLNMNGQSFRTPNGQNHATGVGNHRTHLAFHHNSLELLKNCSTTVDAHAQDGCTAPVGRLFDDFETRLVVKLFRDYFTKGSCPVLNEVRQRTANTVLAGRRTATSIRAKIKRLQTSGRWTDYTGI
ncbi:hypothetical protein CRM22_000361 [Opisthorchis felineus]|uniref:Uncharacterized protein n=1 Tax=Opisthorchis felineus TaxID=147828 RepID=A0A4V3SHA2_OPIFE|nr:hypothetical protein CRM22_000361 [Opisthorchis felineus]